MNDSFLARSPDRRDTIWAHGLIDGFPVAMKTTWCEQGPTLLIQASHGCSDPQLIRNPLHLPAELSRWQEDDFINIEVDRRVAWLTLYPLSGWEELESDALDRVLREFLKTLETNGYCPSGNCHLCGDPGILGVILQNDRVTLACRDCVDDPLAGSDEPEPASQSQGWARCILMGLLGALSGAVLWQVVSIGLYLAMGGSGLRFFALARWAFLAAALALGYCIGWPVGHQISRVEKRGRTAASRSALLCMLPGVAFGEVLYGQWLIQHLGLQPGLGASLRAAIGSDVNDVLLFFMKVAAFVFAVCVARATAVPEGALK